MTKGNIGFLYMFTAKWIKIYRAYKPFGRHYLGVTQKAQTGIMAIVVHTDIDICVHQCCGSGMFIPDPGSWFLPIPDPGSRISDPGSKNSNKRERWKKISCHTFLCSHKFHKIVNYFSFEVLKKKIWANFQRIIELFTKKIVKKLLKIWSWDPGSDIRDPGSGKNLFRIPDPGVKKHRIPDPQHWCPLFVLWFYGVNMTQWIQERGHGCPRVLVLQFACHA